MFPQFQKSACKSKVRCYLKFVLFYWNVNFSDLGHGLKMKFKLLYFKLSLIDMWILIKSSNLDLLTKISVYKCYIRIVLGLPRQQLNTRPVFHSLLFFRGKGEKQKLKRLVNQEKDSFKRKEKVVHAKKGRREINSLVTIGRKASNVLGYKTSAYITSLVRTTITTNVPPSFLP